MLHYKATLKKILSSTSAHSLASGMLLAFDNCVHLFPRVNKANSTNTCLPLKLSFLIVRIICNAMLICNALLNLTLAIADTFCLIIG